MDESKNRQKTILKKIIRYSIYAALVVLILFSSAFLLFSIYKDDIARKIVLALNSRQKGEITLKEISLSPFKYFPDIALRLEGVKYYRQKSPARSDSAQPIIDLNDIYIALDIFDLIKGKLNVSELSLLTGSINLVRRKDGSIDIFSELGLSDTAKTDEPVEQQREKFSVSAKNIELDSIHCRLENEINGNSIDFQINSLDASLAVGGQKEHVLLNTDFVIISYSTTSGQLLSDNSIQINSELIYEEENSTFEIKQGSIVFDNAEFNMNGTVNIEDEGYLDLKLSGSDKDFSFLSLVLRKDALLENRKNLKEGDIYFEGTVKGNITKEIPFAEFTFGMKDVRLDFPVMNHSITDLNLAGYFTTGSKQDLSEAQLLLENFSAELPNGRTGGSIDIRNFVNPYLDVNFYLKSNLAGFDDLFKIDAIDSLEGMVTIQEKLRGTLDPVQHRMSADTVNSEIELENVSFTVPDVITLDKVNGKIIRVNDRHTLENISLISKNSDFNINGTVDNLVYLLFDIDSDISADLSIKSEKFVFPEVMSFDSSAARDFPYTFKNLDFNVQAKTSVSKLLDFDDFPDVDFNVKSLDTEFDGLPDIKNLSGKLSTSEDPFSFNIKFNDLTINTTGGKLILNGLYNGAENLPFYLKTNLITKNLNLRDYLMQFEMDVDSSSLFNAVLNSSMYAEIQFSREDVVFETFTIKNCDINYVIQPDQDTVFIESMTMDFRNVVYDLNQNPNPLATLSTTGKIDFGKISSSEFVLENPAYDISVINGKYKIIPLRSSMFGKRGEGTFEFEPWAEMPEYKIAYSVKQFEIENFLTTFMEESVLTGKMDLSLNISMKGDDWENMLSHLNGNISLTGSNLTLHGLDVDRLLERVARSQNFNLLDVSAVILAGPVGLAITKGTDIASIVMLSPGEKTSIPQLVSIWTMQNGSLDMTDIAFTTTNHRIVSKGYINLAQKNLDVTIAEVNDKGCIVLSQKVSGNLEDPKTGNIKVLESLLSPVTNLFNSIIGKECEVFYNGSVKHPK